jgi:FolB domain-containing protein
MADHPDKIFIRNLMVRGIVGINPDERKNRQDVVVNITMEADTRGPAASDDIDDSVNYRTVAKSVIAHIEDGQPQLVERLATEIANICFASDPKISAAEVTVEKPGAVRFSESVGVSIYRRRDE